MSLILASTSKYRRQQLENLGIRVECIAPLADEKEITTEGKPPLDVAEKRAELKAKSVFQSVCEERPNVLVLGGDQLVSLDGEILGKPGNRENAIAQIQSMAGRTHQLITSICFMSSAGPFTHTNVTTLEMADLSELSIESYVDLDQPFDCAGSYKIEKNGLWLFKQIETEDHSAIQGLPMLKVIEVLRRFGLSPLQ